jgi:hypothetical protein
LAGGSGGPFETLADLDRYIHAVAEAGFNAVSIGQEQIAAAGADSGAVATIAALVDRSGLRCSDVSSLLVRRDDEATLSAAREIARTVEVLGADFVLTLLYTRVSEESVDRLGRCPDRGHRLHRRGRLRREPDRPGAGRLADRFVALLPRTE